MNAFELGFLALVLVAALSIVWSTLRTGISPMMSSSAATQAMLNAIAEPKGPIIDLGSGWGTLVVAAARQYPAQQVIGYELSWLPWLVSCLRKRYLRLDNLTLYRKDFNEADLSQAAILLCYLFPEGMAALAEKLTRQPSRAVDIISNTFALPACQATQTIRLNDIYKTPIYLYRWRH